MALTTIPQIETALNQIETKKTALKTAFENLQSHSTSLSSFTLTWPQLETHFSTLQSNLLSSFSSLKTHQPEKNPSTQPPEKNPSTHPPARPQLLTLCKNMDGIGLRKYLIDHPKDVTDIRTEIADAFARAADPGLLVLDSLNGFCHGKVSAESKFRTACVLLLEELCKVKDRFVVSEEVKEKAKGIAEEWWKKIEAEGGEGGDGGMERLGYLHLIAAYGLGDEWGDREVNEIVDCVVSVARYRQSVDLCRSLGIRTRIPDVIQRLIMKGKQLIALRFVFAFGLSDQFPPVPLLKNYLADAKKSAQNVRKSGKNSRQALNEAGVKEINALKAVIKCVKDHGMESEYSVQDLMLRVDRLEREQAERKKSAPPTPAAAAPVPKPQQKSNQQQSKQNVRKRRAGGATSSGDRRKQPTYSLQPSFTNRAGLVTQEHAAPYLMNQSGGPYAGSSHAAGPYVMGSSANSNVYGLAGAPPGYAQNLNPAAAANHSYHHPSAATHAQPGHHYDNGATVVGGYAAAGYDAMASSSQYHPHPVYYPQ